MSLALGLAAAGVMAFADRARALELCDGEIEFTPRLSAGLVSWDELRSKGGHKSLVGLGLNTDYLHGRNGLNLDLWKWWVSEGLDSNKGIIPKDGHWLRLEGRRQFDANEKLVWYPYLGVAYEEWNRHSLPDKWDSLDFFNAILGVGIEQESFYAKAGLSHPISAQTDTNEDPSGRVGFETEVGLRLSPITIGMFWRGAAFQEPDAKLIHGGVFVAYTF
jgi:hypothetical protein